MPLTANYLRAPFALVTAWENRLSLEQNPTIDRKESGTEFRGSGFQINRTKQMQEVRVNIESMSAYFDIESFLQERAGKPFFFQEVLYRVDGGWDWRYLGGSGVNAVNELSLRLVQMFRP